mgnify:CR=1 FL=1
MPTYLFENPQSGEVIEVFQQMSEKHEYVDESGVKWKRVFSSPQATIKNKKLDFRSKKDVDLYNSVYKKRYEHNKKKGKKE